MFRKGATALGLIAASATALVVTGTGTAAAERGADGHYYLSIAISTDNIEGTFVAGTAANYPDQASADQAALGECGYANCWVVVRSQDGCGAVAARDNDVAGGEGATTGEAARNAIAQLPPPSLLASLSGGGGAPDVFAVHCNG
ncbi:DUF4189 domain-containing protein [Nocardia stercoris]|nr:DUF4189 domain-containing protein [Nocardia stercoris]